MRSILKTLDLILMPFAPLAVIMFVVAAFVLLDRFGTHYRFVQRLEDDGLVATATVKHLYEDEVYVEFVSTQDEERTGFIDTLYYDEVDYRHLQAGDTVEVRYLPESYEMDMVLEAHLDAVRNYWGWAIEGGTMLFISWVIIIIHPEVLYLGYGDEIWKQMMPQGGHQ